MTSQENLHIVVAGETLHIVRRPGQTRLDFHGEFTDFLTSFGPFDADGVLDTFENEWPDTLVINLHRIKDFLASDHPAFTV